MGDRAVEMQEMFEQKMHLAPVQRTLLDRVQPMAGKQGAAVVEAGGGMLNDL
ncbi:hypothetical protein D3C81_1732770 [compost metagenome]